VVHLDKTVVKNKRKKNKYFFAVFNSNFRIDVTGPNYSNLRFPLL
jgi:hypothetical protein